MDKVTESDKLPLYDFHVHSGYSDGEGKVADVAQLAARLGIRVIAVTDHDTTEAAAAVNEYMRSGIAGRVGVEVICGCELSSYITRDGEFDAVHVLGLGVNPKDAVLSDLCTKLNKVRLRELKERITYAANKGYGLSPEVEKRVLKEAWWGKGDIADALVVQGEFPDKDTAYRALWGDYDDMGALREDAPAGDSIEAIHHAGGIACLAHPLRDELARSFVDLSAAAERIRILADVGLDGVEAFYRQFSYADCLELEVMAAEHGLLTSMGSDHHDFGFRNRMGRCCADDGVDMYDVAARITIPDALGVRG